MSARTSLAFSAGVLCGSAVALGTASAVGQFVRLLTEQTTAASNSSQRLDGTNSQGLGRKRAVSDLDQRLGKSIDMLDKALELLASDPGLTGVALNEALESLRSTQESGSINAGGQRVHEVSPSSVESDLPKVAGQRGVPHSAALSGQDGLARDSAANRPSNPSIADRQRQLAEDLKVAHTLRCN